MGDEDLINSIGLCKSGKNMFTRVVWLKFNFLLYCMFDTLMKSDIFSLVTFVMQFFISLLMLLLNINAMFLHMLKVKLKCVIVNELLKSVSFFLRKFSSLGFLLYVIHPIQMIWFMQSRMTFSALVLVWESESRCLAFYMAYIC